MRHWAKPKKGISYLVNYEEIDLEALAQMDLQPGRLIPVPGPPRENFMPVVVFDAKTQPPRFVSHKPRRRR
ncbi:MAG: hypothetical protein KGL39_27500 [Patescibacteria group bacterium]|nr:hypothetical protein [Patescibacteria group bacterium]